MKQLWNGVSVRGAAAESERGTAIWRRPTPHALFLLLVFLRLLILSRSIIFSWLVAKLL